MRNNIFKKLNFVQRYRSGLKGHLFNANVDLEYRIRAIMLNDKAINSKASGICEKKICDKDVVVSLTSYGRRINDVYLAIESIFQQSLKANRVVLWLSEEYRNVRLPYILRLQEERGLEIRFCRDIRSYTKLIPSLLAFPEDVVITIDDDIIYESDLIDKLIREYEKDTSKIYCNRMHRIRIAENGSLEKYNNWEWDCRSTEVSSLNFPTGVGGVLYPPHSFDEEVFNEKIFLSICKYADDVWFKAMSLKNGTECRRVETHTLNGKDFLENPSVQDLGLFNLNVHGTLNDTQIDAVFKQYDLFRLLV